MHQTWRWFGPSDSVSVDAMLQAGVEGVVSALHHVPAGEVWSPEEILKRQKQIGTMSNGNPSGLKWDVVESLAVSEEIKKQKGDWRAHIEAYKVSLSNLAQAEIETICYNFMPVLDWTRTDLHHPLPTGATCMRFDHIDFAAFDLFVLERAGADADFTDEVKELAKARHAEMDEERKVQLTDNLVCGLPGTDEHLTLEDVRTHLAEYDNISAEQLKKHQMDFLNEVIPHCEKLGLRMCCHPDDPPFNLLGLPRVMSTFADYENLVQTVNSPANGITFCTGSLGARGDNDLPNFVRKLGPHIHFAHLRNVKRETDQTYGSFYEAEHLGGDTDMVAVMDALLAEEKRRRDEGRADHVIPFRPDHGQDILDDLKRQTQPGYPAVGRLRGLAELRGVMTALSHAG